MSTTTWFDPARSTSRIARRSAPSTRCSALLDDQRLAEDARGLGQRHRQAPLEIGALGQRRVVVGVTELVRQRLRRVGTARPVHQHQRAIADERHAERATDLAVAWAGVDPPLVESAGRPARRAGRCSRRTHRARSPRLRPSSASPGRPDTGRRGPTTADLSADRLRGASAWPASSAESRAARPLTAACIASNVDRLTALANSEASSGSSHVRRRLTIVASPLIALIAAAQGTATCGQAANSAA